jgi:hypothetical protein
MRAVIVTSCRPHIRPLTSATGAAVKVSKLHGGLLNQAGENRRCFHRVGAALLAVAGVLIRLHFAGEVAVFIRADGRGDRIREHRLHQFLDAVEPIDFNADLDR